LGHAASFEYSSRIILSMLDRFSDSPGKISRSNGAPSKSWQWNTSRMPSSPPQPFVPSITPL
jgi:hypothetical protein